MATKIPKRNRTKISKTITSEESSGYTLSLVTCSLAVFLFNMFIKAYFNHHFLVNIYVDGIVAAVAVVLVLAQIRYQFHLYKYYKVDKRPLLITLLCFALSILATLFSLRTFDFSGILLIIGLFVTRKEANKQWPQ